MSDIPQEIIVSNILLRLPAKTIGRCRCVCKPWLSLLTSYDFIKSHLAHHSHSLSHQQNLLFRSRRCALFSLTFHLGGRGVNRLKKLDFFDDRVIILVGSCNGMVLVETVWTGMWVINCLTEDYVKLPVSPLVSPSPSCTIRGFGYDSLSDDYKIVSISTTSIEDNVFVDIYSLKMRSWRRFRTSPYGTHDCKNEDCGVFFKGALHWIGKKSGVIIAFDLSCEKFKEIPPPSGCDFIEPGKLIVIDECLGIVVEPYGVHIPEIWLMKSYSLVQSWTKIVISEEFSFGWHPFCFHKDKILFGEDGTLTWHYVEDGREEVCMVNVDRRYDFVEAITYSESLVSPHFNSRN